MNKTDREKNIINFIYISGALALIDLRECTQTDRAAVKNAVEVNGTILMSLKYRELACAVAGTIFDVLVPEIPREVTLVLARNEGELDEALAAAFEVCSFTVDHRIIRE